MTPPRQHHRRTRPFNLINAGRCDPVRETPEDFKDLQEALVHTESVEQFLHEMAVMAARMVGGGLSCGMTMRSNGRPVTVACSDPGNVTTAVLPIHSTGQCSGNMAATAHS